MPDIIQFKCILFADTVSIILIQIKILITHLIPWLNECYYWCKSDLNTIYPIPNLSFDINPRILLYGDTKINETTHTKFLGIVIDEDFKLENTCRWCVQQSKQLCLCSQQTQSYSNSRHSISSVPSYVSAVLKYGIILWRNFTEVQRVL